MPIYDFRCWECGKTSEIFLRSPGNQRFRCPGCGSEQLERVFSASYVLKGEMRAPGTTCCGRTERCETPPCSRDEGCHRGKTNG